MRALNNDDFGVVRPFDGAGCADVVEHDPQRNGWTYGGQNCARQFAMLARKSYTLLWTGRVMESSGLPPESHLRVKYLRMQEAAPLTD